MRVIFQGGDHFSARLLSRGRTLSRLYRVADKFEHVDFTVLLLRYLSSGWLRDSYPLTWPPTPKRFPPRSISNFIFWLVSRIWPWPSPLRNVCNGVTISPRRSQAYISSRLRNEAYKMCGFTGLNASYTKNEEAQQVLLL
jgi:hypothetical protein